MIHLLLSILKVSCLSADLDIAWGQCNVKLSSKTKCLFFN